MKPVSKSRLTQTIARAISRRSGSDEEAAETYLNTAIYQLRKALSPHGFKEAVISAQEQYCIVMDRMDVSLMRRPTNYEF